MTRTTFIEPSTWYDGQDDHHYSMNEVQDDPRINDLAISEVARQHVSINGVEHYLAWYSEPDERGRRKATLRPVDRPF